MKIPDDSELRALYDIRVKETHHYNTVIWAFPAAYVILIATEIRSLCGMNFHLLIGSVFNLCLLYIFWRHLQNRHAIQKSLDFMERKLADLYGNDYVPNFVTKDAILLPKATTLTMWSLLVISLLFLYDSLIPYLPFCK